MSPVIDEGIEIESDSQRAKVVVSRLAEDGLTPARKLKARVAASAYRTENSISSSHPHVYLQYHSAVTRQVPGKPPLLISRMDSRKQALAVWETNAEFWDSSMGSAGNDYYNFVELPALNRMIDVKPGERALDLATGNGLVAHWLAKSGATVTATDGSQAMLDAAQRRGDEVRAGWDREISVDYRLLDVTDAEVWKEFITENSGEGKFDIIVINMAIMDIPTLEPLAAAIPQLLKRHGGRFVTTILHPLMSLSAPRVIEYTEDPETGVETATRFLKLKEYLHMSPTRSMAAQGQPAGQFHFNRPLHELFAPFFRAGLTLDALEEPNFDEEYVRTHALSPSSWRAWTQIPKILAFRMRMAAVI